VPGHQVQNSQSPGWEQMHPTKYLLCTLLDVPLAVAASSLLPLHKCVLQEGTALVVLHRPATAGCQGAVLDWLRVLLGVWGRNGMACCCAGHASCKLLAKSGASAC